MPEQKTSDSLEGTLDRGINTATDAKGIYDTAKGIGATAAEVGSAASKSATSAGASAGTAVGTGASTGTAVGGPAGTVLGAVVGLAAGLLVKPLVKAIIVIVALLLLIFSSLPSMFWENPVDMVDNAGPLEVYRRYKDYVNTKYLEELANYKEDIEYDFAVREASGEFDDYDHVEYSYSFNPTESIFLSQLMESSTLVVSMFEIQQDDWRKASFNEFKQAVDSVNFWNGTIECTKESEDEDVTYDDGESTVHIHMVYGLTDTGVEAFRSKFGLADDKEYIKSVEMAYNTKLYFGEADDLPMGGVTGGATGSYPGGGTHNAIRTALAALENPLDFFGGVSIITLPIGTWIISSEFGPRNYAPDPLHTGLDFSADNGTPIYSAMDGIVLLQLTNVKTFGNHIVVYHGNRITTMYAHMSSFGSYQVGDVVSKGAVIGYVGRTGLSTGDHLHFEYQINGSARNPRLILPL